VYKRWIRILGGGVDLMGGCDKIRLGCRIIVGFVGE
jgi:hypothetical protein